MSNSDQMNADVLNEEHGIENQLRFVAGNGGLTKAVIENRHATADIYLFGAHVTRFRPINGDDVIWLSPTAVFDGVKAIRGGIPICWPWFGPHPTDDSMPAHGLARTSHWHVLSTNATADGATTLSLGLESNAHTQILFPFQFQLRLDVTISKKLSIELSITNTDSQPFDSGAALHTYYQISDVKDVQCSGLENVDYIDKVDGMKIKSDQGPVRITAEEDRVYVNTADTVMIKTAARTLRVAKEGSRSTILWNPWIDKARSISDMPNDGYQTMICIETANAASDVRQIAAGDTHRIGQTTSLV
ncbi:MAG: D-hexose-6-phosphate mutarotase [Pirellulaceae bacterium]|nr:D-hexose-6-phosphate mutarotase [Pirellulaceae bacterium]